MKPILEIQNISKTFRILHENQPYLNLRDSISSIFKSKNNSEEFFALKDVSFNVMSGESIGIIGKNGAGKSTLLKILSKITPPTTGKIISRGRIASLLEVGTGFHGELSGRENVFLNGSILGMKKAEIQKKFDAIVDFSGVEKFLDTPLKHYSSGMQLRLAFAVAAFLENEILIIDEVLSVGDADFQKKCLSKMEDVTTNQGRTILFVSHNLTQVQHLCKKGLLLSNGIVDYKGNINQTVSNYINGNGNVTNFILTKELPRTGHRDVAFTFEWVKLIGIDKAKIKEGDEIRLQICFSNKKIFSGVVLGVTISNEIATLIECRSTASFELFNLDNLGEHLINVKFKVNLLAGNYSINIGARSSKGLLEYIQSVFRLDVDTREDNTEDWKKGSAGLFITQSTWTK